MKIGAGPYEGGASCRSSKNKAMGRIWAMVEKTFATRNTKRSRSSRVGNSSWDPLAVIPTRLKISLSTGHPAYSNGIFCNCSPSTDCRSPTKRTTSISEIMSCLSTDERHSSKTANGAASWSLNFAMPQRPPCADKAQY